MDFSRYVKLIFKKFWVIVLLEIVALTATYFYTDNLPVYYTTSATLILNPSNPNALVPYLNRDNTYASNLADNYNLIIKTDNFVNRLQDQLSFKLPTDQLKNAYNSKLTPNTLFYYISATASTPQHAQELANKVTQLFLSEGLRQSNGTVAKPAQAEDVLSQTINKQRDEIKQLQNEIDDLNQQIRTFQATPGSNLGQNAADIQTLNQQLKDKLDIQSRLIQNVNLNSGRTTDTTRDSALLVDEAKLPGLPDTNNLLRNIIFAAMLALALGVGTIVLLDYLDYTIRSSEDLEKLTGVSTLATVPVIRPKRIARQNAAPADSAVEFPTPLATDNLDTVLVTAFTFSAPEAEAYRALRTNVLFSALAQSQPRLEEFETIVSTSEPVVADDSTSKVFLVTSTRPGEGKSVTAANLALAFALAGSRVVLVDADLRKPSIHKLFGLDNQKGLSDLILAGPGALPTTIHQTNMAQLQIITAGTIPPNPSELLTNPKMVRLLEALREQTDIVVIDSPPAGLVTDAVVLSARVDKVLLVVSWGTVRRDAIIKSVNSIRRIGGEIMGTVLNRAQEKSAGNYYYYGYGYGGYGTKRKPGSKAKTAKTESSKTAKPTALEKIRAKTAKKATNLKETEAKKAGKSDKTEAVKTDPTAPLTVLDETEKQTTPTLIKITEHSVEDEEHPVG